MAINHQSGGYGKKCQPGWQKTGKIAVASASAFRTISRIGSRSMGLRMTRTDHKAIFTALGFLAVILHDVPQDKQALRATAIAGLIESFCMATVPEAFGDHPAEDTFSVPQRMAYVIASIVKVHGECRPHDLKDQEFTPDQIARHWPAAYALACVSLNIEPKDS
jgi:hypothetical protein